MDESDASQNGSTIVCVDGSVGLPADAPTLFTDVWTHINLPGFPFEASSSATGMAVTPCNPSVIYMCTGSFTPNLGGMYRTTNAGKTWSKIGRVTPNYSGTDHLDQPNHVRVDPANPQHVYAVDGIRGNTGGFYVSTNAGDSFVMPDGFLNLSKTADRMFPFDVYDLAVDPADFSHILLSHHSGWTGKWGLDSGVLESVDGGATWIIHEPQPGWGTGHAIHFLYQPDRNIGDRNTWLLGTGPGMLRTSDAGQTWTKVTSTGIQGNGGTVYYDKTGALYASGYPHNLRSTDNGVTWTEIGASNGYSCIFGDGNLLYTRGVFGTGPFSVSAEGDGVSWRDFNAQQLPDGPFEMALDPIHGVLYSSTGGSGLLALKVAPR